MRIFCAHPSLKGVCIEEHLTHQARPLWHYTLDFNSNVIQEKVLCFLDCFDADFVKQLAVTAGNLYQNIMEENYPQYLYGMVKDQNGIHTARISSQVTGCSEIHEYFEVKNDSEGKFEIRFKSTKPIRNFMSAFALSLFFDDTDIATNLLLVEDENEIKAVKIDPEAAFGKAFFREEVEDIQSSLQPKMLFHSDAYKAIRCGIVEHLGRVLGLPFEVAESELTSLLESLFETKEAHHEFYFTLNKILIKLKESHQEIVELCIDAKYVKQKELLKQAITERIAVFDAALYGTTLYDHKIPEDFSTNDSGSTRIAETFEENIKQLNIADISRKRFKEGNPGDALQALGFAICHLISADKPERQKNNFIILKELYFYYGGSEEGINLFLQDANIAPQISQKSMLKMLLLCKITLGDYYFQRYQAIDESEIFHASVCSQGLAHVIAKLSKITSLNALEENFLTIAIQRSALYQSISNMIYHKKFSLFFHPATIEAPRDHNAPSPTGSL